MRLLATLDLDIEITDQEAHERFGSMDPYSVARTMRETFVKQGSDGGELDGTPIKLVGVTVVPAYG